MEKTKVLLKKLFTEGLVLISLSLGLLWLALVLILIGSLVAEYVVRAVVDGLVK